MFNFFISMYFSAFIITWGDKEIYLKSSECFHNSIFLPVNNFVEIRYQGGIKRLMNGAIILGKSIIFVCLIILSLYFISIIYSFFIFLIGNDNSVGLSYPFAILSKLP